MDEQDIINVRYQTALADQEASEARKSSAGLELKTAFLRNEIAVKKLEWRERECGECGYSIGLSVGEGHVMVAALFCRKYRLTDPQPGLISFDVGGQEACPDFVPRKVEP